MGIFLSTPPALDIPYLKGKVVLVTGGNTGIGYETVAQLVKHGAKVYMGARSESRATGAMARLKADGYLDSPDAGEVIWLEVDLSTPAQAKRAAQEFMRREMRLDILINNAGIGHLTPNAFELVANSKIAVGTLMATNHLGPFTFTKTLLPLLSKTAAELGSDVRVVTVSSRAHSHSANMDWKDLHSWNFKSGGFFANLGAYGTTKLANLLFAKQLQLVFDQNNINALSIAINPGGINTESIQNLMPHYSWTGYLMYHLFKLTGQLLTPTQGAYTTLFAATSLVVAANRRKFAGAYLMPFGVLAEPSEVAKDPVAAQDLWETSEKIVDAM
ncbi:hypothetical protein FRB93_014064 [Tulasnella sp. JGI-2019a]|nr:hypothetical protein FRB93_014064 [Tulasnella sp. JGI-2019a]